MLSKYGNGTRLRQIKTSLRSKRFRLVSEQKKTVERDFRLWPRENQKAPFFARSLTLVPHSLLLNRTETLATQAKLKLSSKSVVFTNKVGKNSRYFVDVLNNNYSIRACWIWDDYSQRLVGYLPSHIQRALVE